MSCRAISTPPRDPGYRGAGRDTLPPRLLPAVQPGSFISDVYLTVDTIWWLAIEGSTPVVYRAAK